MVVRVSVAGFRAILAITRRAGDSAIESVHVERKRDLLRFLRDARFGDARFGYARFLPRFRTPCLLRVLSHGGSATFVLWTEGGVVFR